MSGVAESGLAVEYLTPIDDVHAEIERLEWLVFANLYPRSLLDSYVTAARNRHDWTEPINQMGVSQ